MDRSKRGQKRARAASTAVLAILTAGQTMAAVKQLRPGFNLFTPQQDVQIGKEAAVEIEREMTIVHNPQLDRYLSRLLGKLEQSRNARTLQADGSRAEIFPFQIHAVANKNINAFSLPGGPIFVNTGAIGAAENEAQLAGVIAHEMSHIVLRHPTNQASKRNLVALPVLLAGALAGNSLLGQLAQIGIGFTANSALLKFSRADEAEADYNGVQIMADAGYDPRELGRFFGHLEAKTGRGDALTQFLSDHPNPGNRAAAIEEEMRDLPRRAYATDEAGQFARVRDLVRSVAVSAPRKSEDAEAVPKTPGEAFRTYSGRSFALAYPENWEVQENSRGEGVTITPRDGRVEQRGKTFIGYGLEVGYYVPDGRDAEPERDTESLIRQFQQANADMRVVRAARNIQVDSRLALLSTLSAQSPFGNQRETDVLVTVARPRGLFYIVFIAPEQQFQSAQHRFEEIVKSVRFE